MVTIQPIPPSPKCTARFGWYCYSIYCAQKLFNIIQLMLSWSPCKGLTKQQIWLQLVWFVRFRQFTWASWPHKNITASESVIGASQMTQFIFVLWVTYVPEILKFKTKILKNLLSCRLCNGPHKETTSLIVWKSK